MPNYELDITFDQAGLDALSASGQKVTIVKQSSGGKPTAWITFKPQLANSVTWTEQYSVYSSTTNAQAGATIITSSEATAIGGSSYTLNTSGYFDNGVAGVVGPTQYQIINADPDLMINSVPMVSRRPKGSSSSSAAEITPTSTSPSNSMPTRAGLSSVAGQMVR